MAVLILNGGSTGWKIAAYDDVVVDAVPFSAPRASVDLSSPEAGNDGTATLVAACEKMKTSGALDGLRAIGHRIVHGGERFTASVRIDDGVEDALRALEPLAPSHNARELAAIDAMGRTFPDVPQVAVFDTVFHRTLPAEAYTYPGPYAWRERGIRRFGFHGSSVAYNVERASQLLERPVAEPSMIVAHLGGGCSVTAVRDGTSVDTSMGFTPLDGTMMATRSGSVDPGILTFLARERAAGGDSAAAIADDFDRALNRESGLLGISGISSDLREIEAAARQGDERARLALDVFAHRTAATIGAMTASLERIDALVFSGGIGAHAVEMRERVCARLVALGISLDAQRNAAEGSGDRRIERRCPAVLVIETREEWYVARECARVLR